MNRKEFIGTIAIATAGIILAPAVLAGRRSEVGKNHAEFYLTFDDDYFNKNNLMVGPNGVPIHIKDGPKFVDGKYEYTCQIFSADPQLYIPSDYLEGDVKFHKDWSIVEKTLEKKGK